MEDPLASVCVFALAQGASPPTVLRMHDVCAAERCLTRSASVILMKKRKISCQAPDWVN